MLRCLVPALLFAHALAAQAQPLAAEWQRCARSDAAPDDGIAACTAIIDAGTERGQNLAIAHFNRANGWLAKGEFDRAIADLSGAISLDRTNAKAFFNRGNAWVSAAARTTARFADFDEAIRLDPDFVAALRQPRQSPIRRRANSTARSSISTMRSGLRRRMRACWRCAAWRGARRARWISRSPTSTARSRSSRTMRACSQRTRRDTACGRPIRPRAGRFHRSDPARSRQARARLRNRGLAYLARGNLDAAIADFDEALRLDPADADTHVNRGTALQLKGDLERALADYEPHCASRPNMAAALSGRGNVFLGARRTRPGDRGL